MGQQESKGQVETMGCKSARDDSRRPPHWAIGILVGPGGLPLQEQHRDHAEYHVVALMRCTRARPDLGNTVIHMSRLGCVVTTALRSLAVPRRFPGLLSSITMTCFRCKSSAVTCFFLTAPYRMAKEQSPMVSTRGRSSRHSTSLERSKMDFPTLP